VAGAVEPGLRIRIETELRARAAAHEYETGLLAACHVSCVVISDKILEQTAAVSRRLTGLEEAEVLDQEGYALQGCFGVPRRDRLAGLLVLFVHDRVDGGIDLLGPCDRCLQHLLGADLALADELSEGDGVVLTIFLKPHGLRISK
jgi:hypothetical protein